MIFSTDHKHGRFAAGTKSGIEARMAASFPMRLERSMETLMEDNRKLQEQVSRLQRQADDQAGQLKVLLSFVHTSLRDQVDTRAERAAIGVFERLIAFKSDGNPEDQR
jgi:hypothetical protein